MMLKSKNAICFPVHVSDANIPGFITIHEKVNFMFKAYYFLAKSEVATYILLYDIHEHSVI